MTTVLLSAMRCPRRWHPTRRWSTLESTVIAQGLPWPENLETVQAAQATVRGAGAAPATIAVLDGVIRVGLTEIELLRIAVACSANA